MNAHDLTLLTDWDGSTSLRGWYVSEKMDGCRALWDGDRMLTRSGNPIQIPDDLLARLPRGVVLDGEIHAGRGGFEEARLAVQNGFWKASYCRFTAFDSPLAHGDWSHRISHAASCWGDTVQWTIYKGLDPYGAALEVQFCGGEGLVFRKPGKPYARGRDTFSVRVK